MPVRIVTQTDGTRNDLVCFTSQGVLIWSVPTGPSYESYSAFEDTVIVAEPKENYINAEDYPGLASLWDNAADAIYDSM